MTKVLGTRHIGIIVKDLERSKNFYANILGLQIIQRMVDDSPYISEITNLDHVIAEFIKLKMPDSSVLELLKYHSHPTNSFDGPIIQTGIAHIALQVESIDKMYSHLISNKIKVLSKPTLSSEGFAKVFFCLDPDNFRVEIVEIL